jgi:biopolymer transport protein ExbD
MAMNSAGAHDAPMMDINTTPLIDVMLVLLIMFIITIPMQTHAVKMDSAVGDPPPYSTPPPRNEIAVTHGGQVLWNGAPVDLVRLRQYLDASQRLDPVPELTIRPASDARYELVDKVLAVTKRAQVVKVGFVGNENYAHDF